MTANTMDKKRYTHTHTNRREKKDTKKDNSRNKTKRA